MPADRAVQPVNLHSHIFNFTIERTKEIILEALICLLLCEAAFIDIVLNNIHIPAHNHRIKNSG